MNFVLKNEITNMPLVQQGWTGSKWLGFGQLTEPPLSLSSPSSKAVKSPTPCSGQLRQLHRHGVGQTTPPTPLYLLTEGIELPVTLVAMPIPAHLGLGFHRWSSPPSALVMAWCRVAICAFTAWCGGVSFILYRGVSPPLVARALPRCRGAMATVGRYVSFFPPSTPL